MTRQEALKKAARLTKADVPTRVVKNTAQPGGHQTKAVAVVQAAQAKYRKTDKRRVTLARYDKSLRGRAAHAKYRRTAKRHAVLARYRNVLNRQGLPIIAADIEVLRREWEAVVLCAGRSCAGAATSITATHATSVFPCG
jgi:hypothetical protein